MRITTGVWKLTLCQMVKTFEHLWHSPRYRSHELDDKYARSPRMERRRRGESRKRFTADAVPRATNQASERNQQGASRTWNRVTNCVEKCCQPSYDTQGAWQAWTATGWRRPGKGTATQKRDAASRLPAWSICFTPGSITLYRTRPAKLHQRGVGN